MSFDKPTDPYATPAAESFDDKRKLDMQRAFRYMFDDPNWFVNLLLVLVCMMIPVIGPIVFFGYQFELIEALLDRPKDLYPKLDFGRFVDYLKRGVWPFLAALIGQLVITPLTLLFVLPMICLFPLAGGLLKGGDTEALGVVCMIAAVVLIVVGSIAVNIIAMCIVTPMMLGAGLAQEIGPAIDFAYIKGFISRTWKEMAAAYLWLMLITLVLMPLGMLVFCVGHMFVAAWAWMAMAHVDYQLYALYLDRGGAPITLKSKGASPAA